MLCLNSFSYLNISAALTAVSSHHGSGPRSATMNQGNWNRSWTNTNLKLTTINPKMFLPQRCYNLRNKVLAMFFFNELLA